MSTPTKKERKSFKDFTNEYSLSKTLRFSLIPVLKEDFEGKELTREQKTDLFYERKDKLIESERELSEYYKKIKELLNELHQEFIQEAMHSFVFDIKELGELETNYLNLLKEKNNDDYKKKDELRRKLDNSVKKLEQKISKYFNGFESEKYKINNIIFSKKNLLGKEVIQLLQEKYKNDSEKYKIVEKFDKFTTYLSGFSDNRDNYYKSENKSGQFATRAIRDNLLQFLKNRKTFIDKYKDNYKKIGIREEQIEIFELSYFNNLLLQEGIDEYNGVIGNKKGEKNITNEGINQKINTFAQKQKSLRKDFRKQDYPFFREVYKQIGSVKKDDESRFIEINNDGDLLSELKNIPILTKDYIRKTEKFYKDFFLNIKNNKYDLDKIYFPKKTGTYFSYLAFTEGAKVASVYRNTDAYKLEQEGKDINDQARSLAEIKKAIEERENGDISFKQKFKNDLKVGSDKTERWRDFLLVIEKNIEKSFVGGTVEMRGNEEVKESLSELEEKYNQAIKDFEKVILEKRAFSEDEEKDIKAGLKGYLDRILEIDRIGRYFDLKKHFNSIDEAGIDSEFYNSQEKDSVSYYDLLKDSSELKIYTHYDEIRNYLTGRSKNEEKFKLNFNEAQLLGGWDLNMESTKLSLIFRNNGKYYLGIINKNKDKKIFDKKNHSNIFIKNSNWEKMEFKYFGDVKRQLPRIAFSEKARSGKEDVGWSLEMQKIKDEFDEFQKVKKGNKEKWKDSFDKIKTSKLISYYQQVLQRHSENYKDIYKLKWKNSNEYKNIGEFNNEIQRQVYKMNFTNVDESYIKEKIENEGLYLFQIYNKDFSENKKSDSTDNLETMYFKEIFSDKNIKNPLFALGANAEIFFRDKIKKEKQKEKKTTKGEVVLDARRFTEDKISFHLPIEINFGKGNKKQAQFNREINKCIANNKSTINIIGIDRGEKNLLYFSLIDFDGNIKKIETLNTIYGVDYQRKLDEKEKEKQENRKSWQPIVGIKNLKKGYLSFAVKHIVDMAIENNAIIVLEDLNFGFKSGRQKIERNVYQQFEKALIDKLNLIVDKKKQNQRHATQLSAPFESFEKIKKQTGIVFYVTASYTSKVCPKCNWQRNIYVHFNGIKNTKENYEKQNLKIFYEKEKDRFRFEYTGNDKEKYLVYSDVDRFHWDKKLNNGKGETVELANNYKNFNGIEKYLRQKGSITGNLKKLFGDKFVLFDKEEHEGFNFNLDDKDIFKKMVEDNSAIGKLNPEKWKSFVFLFNRILEIRNSVNNENREEDNIICPSCHFDSRKSFLIKDGDANGAYNIAKKGLMVIDRISKNQEKPNLYFKNEEYKKFVKDNKIGIKE